MVHVFDGETVLDRVVTERDGYSVYVERSTDGKVVYTRPTDEQGQPIEESFALRRNPFDVMTAADFEYVGNGVWQLTDMDKASDHAYALTGVREEIEKFELLATGSTLTGVHIVSAINHTQQEIFGFLFNYYIRDEYTLTQDKNGAAVPADRFSDYTHRARQIRRRDLIQCGCVAYGTGRDRDAQCVCGRRRDMVRGRGVLRLFPSRGRQYLEIRQAGQCTRSGRRTYRQV